MNSLLTKIETMNSLLTKQWTKTPRNFNFFAHYQTAINDRDSIFRNNDVHCFDFSEIMTFIVSILDQKSKQWRHCLRWDAMVHTRRGWTTMWIACGGAGRGTTPPESQQLWRLAWQCEHGNAPLGLPRHTLRVWAWWWFQSHAIASTCCFSKAWSLRNIDGEWNVRRQQLRKPWIWNNEPVSTIQVCFLTNHCNHVYSNRVYES